MAPDWGTAPWRIDARVPRVALPERCDVAVVGAGFAGLSSAYHLARRGTGVVVLEASLIGAGASGRTGGIVLEGTAAGELQGAERCMDSLGEIVGEAGIDCDLRLPGCWELSHRDDATCRPGWPDAGKRLCASDAVAGGTLDPGALLSGLARRALERGAAIVEGARVNRIELGAGVTFWSAGRRLHADRAVLALNAYTVPLLDLPAEIHPALTLALCTAALAPDALRKIGLDERPFYTVDLPYLWGRAHPRGGLVLGAGLVFPAGRDVTRVGLRDPEAAAALERLEARVRSFHPVLSRIAIERRWGGPIAFRSDRAPVLGRHPSCAQVIVTGAFAGHGVALAVHVGKLVADALTNGSPLPPWGAVDQEKAD